MVERLSWIKIDTGMGWNRHEGVSENSEPYVIEKEDTRLFSAWWNGIKISEADHVATAKRECQAHFWAQAKISSNIMETSE